MNENTLGQGSQGSEGSEGSEGSRKLFADAIK